MGLVKRVRDKLDTRCLVDGRLKIEEEGLQGLNDRRDQTTSGYRLRQAWLAAASRCAALRLSVHCRRRERYWLGRSTRTETGPLACR